MKDIRQKLLATFQVEHRDHVEQIRSLLSLIQSASGQPAAPELDEAFRRAHSLKGAARAVDLGPVEGLAHRVETLFSRVRQGALILSTDVCKVVQQSLDAMEDCVAALGDNRPTPGFQSALHAIEGVLGMEPDKAEKVEAPAPAPAPAFQSLDTIRITAGNFDGLLQSAGGLLAESQRQSQVAVQLAKIVREIEGVTKEAEGARRAAARALRAAGQKPGFARLNSSLSSIELRARSLSKAMGTVCRFHQHSSWAISRLGKQLQRDVWQARMIPADSLLEGYRKMMRDLARDEGKDIDFRVTSTGALADRRVLDALKDPLMHMLRNAVSHGIESPQERVAKGKAAVGVVTLRVNTEGQRLTIAIEDDGRGVDLARVAEVAIKQKILSEADVPRTSPQELARILFRPGFSTSRKITSLSGRGMGLSVVYEAVRRLQGDVDLQPLNNAGTALHIAVPLSISVHKLLLVRCLGQIFALPVHGIERLHRIKLKQIETVEGKPVLLVDGQPLPLYTLQHLLNLSDSPAGRGPDALLVMVVRSRAGRSAVVVDSFLGEREAVIQDLGPGIPDGGGVSGGVLLEDGEIALVLNLMELLENSRGQTPLSILDAPAPVKVKAAPSILVVDDSLTTRTLEKSILEANGYKVQVAVDGVDALARLREEQAALVISDVEMPRLDGFGLLAAMKNDPSLKQIPVIIVSSLDRREDQERGLELGADAYVVKRKFDQEELLEVIRQIL